MTADVFLGLNRNDQLVISPVPNVIKCGKRDCYFCEKMIGVKVKHEKQKGKPESLWLSRRWTFDELELLKRNIKMPTEEIIKKRILKGRTAGAIDNRKSQMRETFKIGTFIRKF